MQRIDSLYKCFLQEIIYNGYESRDRRLFHKFQPEQEVWTKAINSVVLQLDLQKDGFPLISLRKISIEAFVAETIWFLIGDNMTGSFLRKYTNIWEDYTEEDGTVTSYGYRWRKHFGRDQIIGALEMLKEDPSSRHGVVITWDPSEDSLSNGVKRVNVPCQIGFMLTIIEEKLHFHSIWRSVDMILGFPYDIAGNALLAYIFASYLGIEVGQYIHYIANAHIYDIHYSIAEELIAKETNQLKINLIGQQDWYKRATEGDTSLVEEITSILKSQYTDFDVSARKIGKII